MKKNCDLDGTLPANPRGGNMTERIHTNEAFLAPNLTLRPAHWQDAQAVADLTLAVCTADGDPVAARTREDIERLEDFRFQLETDAWVVLRPPAGGGLTRSSSTATLTPTSRGWLCPSDFEGRGIGTRCSEGWKPTRELFWLMTYALARHDAASDKAG
jgi:hypothetical protein